MRIKVKMLISLIIMSFFLTIISSQSALAVPSITSGKIYRLKNVNSGKYLTVHMGYDKDSYNIYQSTSDNSRFAQEFRIVYDSVQAAYKLYAICSMNGDFRVVNIKKSNGVVTNNCNVTLYSPTDNDGQLFQITNTGNEKYKILAKSNTTCGLAAYGTSNGTGTGTTSTSAGNVFMQTYTGANNQLWYIEEFNDRHEEHYNSCIWQYPFEYPGISSTIRSGYGYRIHPIDGIEKFHNGIDFSASSGTELYPMFEVSTVIDEGFDDSRGNYIILESNSDYAWNSNKKIRTVYMHMRDRANFTMGTVVFNQVVGYVGNTGSSTGNHLHLSMIIVGGTATNINTTNNPLMYLRGYTTFTYTSN